MEKTPQQRALDVLEASLDLAEQDRQRVLEEAGRSDPAIAAELLRLQDALTAAPGLMPTHPGHATETGAVTAMPEQIGPFRLLGMVGRGGMGTVYRAIRNDGFFDQQVAIKLLTKRRWSEGLERLFAEERRILARLEHRNIARILDGGVTPDGLSYFVMEYIDGSPINEFCDQQRLGIRARIELLGQLCNALQFAHQQLIVHADIKPSNVLVTTDGSVKLLDFGIAQLVDRGRQASDQTTNKGSSSPGPLTAAYAAPERVAGAAPSVAADVYSLGVLLRELLNGCAPHETVPNDLAAVIEQATAPGVASRYGSVAALSQDLRRWLRYFPVSAMRVGSLKYRTRLFATRNRAAVLIGALTLFGLSAATAISTRLYFSAEKARTAEAQRAAEIRDLNTFVTLDLGDQMVNRPGMAEAAWQTLATTRTRLEALAAADPANVELQIELGRNISRIVFNLFESRPRTLNMAAIRTELGIAENRLKLLEGEGSNKAEYFEVRAEFSYLNAIWALRFDGRPEQALQHAQTAADFATRASRLNPASYDAHAALLEMQLWVAAAQNAQGKMIDGLATIDNAIAVATASTARIPVSGNSDRRLRRALTSAAFSRCDMLRWSAADASALTQCRSAENQLREMIRREGPLTSYESNLAYTLFLIAPLLPAPAQSAQSLALLDEARDIYRRILHFGTHQRIAGDLLVVEAARANALAALGRFTEARATAALLLAERRKRFAAEPLEHNRHREVATALRRVGEVELLAGQRAAACAAFRDANEIWTSMERAGTLLGFDQARPSGQVPWIRDQLTRCPK